MGFDYSPIRRAAVMAKSNGRCFYCGKTPAPSEVMARDHVVPQGDGGSHDIENLVPACQSCNRIKGVRPVDDLRVHLARRAAGWIYFSPAQVEWLMENSALPKLEPYVFYGETIGWTWDETRRAFVAKREAA